jgi:1,2-dihydroxy-3-keto-5-methylthiopentene dioxygenase
MTSLLNPRTNELIEDFSEIQGLLKERGIAITRWKASFPLGKDDDQATILKAYAHEIEPFMKKHGYQSADVINVHPQTENIAALREKFLREHTHSENEIRFFVDGEGHFWFRFENDEVLRLTCVRGDFLSVPKGYRHWFDLAPKYHVKAIRIFTGKEGWVANYTNSGIDEKYISRQP